MRLTRLLAVVAAVLVLAPVAAAARPASRAEALAIRAAVDVAFGCEGCRWRVERVRVSTVDAQFAVAYARGTRNGEPLQGATVLAWRGARSWAVISYASDPAELGCGYVSDRVRRDLLRRVGRCRR